MQAPRATQARGVTEARRALHQPSRAGLPLVDLIDRGSGSNRTGSGGSAEADDAANRELWVQIRDFLTLPCSELAHSGQTCSEPGH